MTHWLLHTLLPSAIVVAVLLVVLWPTSRSGQRVLRTWGIPDPSPDQVAEAVRYLRQRRALYVVLFLVVPALAGLVPWDGTRLPGLTLFVPLLAAMFVAELVATLRPVSGVRVASLDRRGWRDLVPRWAVAAVTVLVLLTVWWAVVGLLAQPYADRYAAALPPNGPTVYYSDDYRAEMTAPTGWLALGYAAAAVVLTVLLVRLAVRRPSVADAAVDAALRTRTARVAVGICLGWLGAAVVLAAQRVQFVHALSATREPWLPPTPSWLTGWLGATAQGSGPVVLLAAVLAWTWLANGTRRSPAPAP